MGEFARANMANGEFDSVRLRFPIQESVEKLRNEKRSVQMCFVTATPIMVRNYFSLRVQELVND